MKTILKADGVLAGLLLAATTTLLASVALPAQAASFRCGAQTGSGNVQTIDASPCVATVGSPAESAEGVAGDGILRGQSHVVGSVIYPDGLLLTANSLSQISDTAIVSGLGESGALLSFSVRVSGDLSAFASPTDPRSPYNASVSATYNFVASLGGAGPSAGGTTAHLFGCTRNANSDIDFCNGPAPAALSIDQIVPLSVFAHNGDQLSFGLLLSTSAFARVQGTNAPEAKADFSHTVSWLGLVSDADSSGLVLTSSSGFDYVGAAVSDAVPEPAAWALMIAGFGLVGATLRRRTAERSAG